VLSADANRIRETLERNAKAVSLRPSVGQNTARTSVRLQPGLTCEIEEGAWKLTVAMSEKMGGSNAGPNPGVMGRAALGSCLALGYGMWSARLGVPLTSLQVEVEADYDSRGELGVDPSIPPGYLQVLYIVSVESPAPREDVERLIDHADQCSAFLDVYRRAHDVRRLLKIKEADNR